VNAGAAAQQNAGGRVRPAVIISIVLHAVAFLCAVGLPRLMSSGPSGNKVYVVDLVALPGGGPAAAAPAAAPVPEPPKPAPVPPPETKKAPEIKKEVVKKAPPPKPIPIPEKNAPKKETVKTPKPPVKPPPEPPKPVEPPDKKEKEKEEEHGGADASDENAQDTAAATAAATQTSPSAAGKPTPAGGAPGTAPGAGAGGPGTGTGSGDEYDLYITILKRRIEAAWKRPVSTSRETRTAAVYFELSPTGRLLKLELKNPSGYVPFDRSIVQAVRDAEPFPAFPLALKLDRLNPTLEFELTPLQGGASPP
jgi:protein TonB